MNSMHVTDWIPSYVLGILEPVEVEAVVSHVARCLACQKELRAYRAVMEQLPAAVALREPPARLRAAILQKAVAQEIQANPPQRRTWLAWLTRPINPVVGLIGLLIIVALAGLNVSLWQQMQHTAAPVPVSTPVSTPVAGNFRLVRMTAPQGSDATGLLVISDEGDFGTLVVDGLQTLDATQQYQLWLIKDGKRTNGGVFSVQSGGYGMLKVNSPLPLIQYQSYGITIEPFGGSPGPTGPKVLGGSL